MYRELMPILSMEIIKKSPDVFCKLFTAFDFVDNNVKLVKLYDKTKGSKCNLKLGVPQGPIYYLFLFFIYKIDLLGYFKNMCHYVYCVMKSRYYTIISK